MSESKRTMNRAGNAEGDWKVTELCYNCDQPIAQWDSGTWAHIRMGQIECTIKHADSTVAEPIPEKEAEKQYVLSDFYRLAKAESPTWTPGVVDIVEVECGYQVIESTTGQRWTFDKESKMWYRVNL